MSNVWRVVNPALNPPQVLLETGDEQTALREHAAREGYLRELHKSEDEGKTWAVIEARAPDAAPPPRAEKAPSIPPLAEKSDEGDIEKPQPEKRGKASK